MGLIELILTLAVVGFLTWLVVTYIPMPDPIPKIIIAIVVICMVLLVLRLFVGDIPIGRPIH